MRLSPAVVANASPVPCAGPKQSAPAEGPPAGPSPAASFLEMLQSAGGGGLGLAAASGRQAQAPRANAGEGPGLQGAPAADAGDPDGAASGTEGGAQDARSQRFADTTTGLGLWAQIAASMAAIPLQSFGHGAVVEAAASGSLLQPGSARRMPPAGMSVEHEPDVPARPPSVDAATVLAQAIDGMPLQAEPANSRNGSSQGVPSSPAPLNLPGAPHLDAKRGDQAGAVALGTAPPEAFDVAAALPTAAPPTETSRDEQRVAAAPRPTTGSPGGRNGIASVLLHEARGDEHQAPEGGRSSSPTAQEPAVVQAVVVVRQGAASQPQARQVAGAPVPASERAELVSRVAASIEAMHGSGGRQEAVLHLSPPHLGELRVEVTSDRSGLVAQITASTEDARSLLHGARDQLRAVLEQRGINVAGLGVALHQHHQRHAEDAPRRSSGAPARVPAMDAAEPAALNATVQVGGLSSWRNGRLDARV